MSYQKFIPGDMLVSVGGTGEFVSLWSGTWISSAVGRSNLSIVGGVFDDEHCLVVASCPQSLNDGTLIRLLILTARGELGWQWSSWFKSAWK